MLPYDAKNNNNKIDFILYIQQFLLGQTFFMYLISLSSMLWCYTSNDFALSYLTNKQVISSLWIDCII